ncbi:MAG: NUDIX domain-containing protein [Magnetococcales bacterium]|nr:NUDIX domain-containing protein [Magnetococcales bacterium]
MTIPDPAHIHPSVIVLPYQNGRILMQLRDDRSDIVYPDCWGYFGGGMEQGEATTDTAFRELQEELGWKPDRLTYLSEDLLTIPGWVRLTSYATPLTVELASLVLTEGVDLGLFTLAEIKQGQLFSKRTHREHPVIPHPFMLTLAHRLRASLDSQVGPSSS